MYNELFNGEYFLKHFLPHHLKNFKMFKTQTLISLPKNIKITNQPWTLSYPIKNYYRDLAVFSRKRAILVAETCSCAVAPSVGRRAICPLSLLCARKVPQIATKRRKIRPEISS